MHMGTVNSGSVRAAPLPLLTVGLSHEKDVVTARQRARQLARLLGFDAQDQIRLATATSEIARNAIQYAGCGRIEFAVQVDGSPCFFLVDVSDSGPGIANLEEILDGRYQSRTGLGIGLVGTRRIMDRFSMESTPGEGTRVIFAKVLPLAKLNRGDVARIIDDLARESPKDAEEELRHQNKESLATLELLRRSQLEVHRVQEQIKHLNQELEATNRGVVALYAELDQRAEALRSANEIKTLFLSHMSHEFRTPLNSILGLTKLLLRRADGDLTPDQEKQVGFVRRAAEELFDMVSDLLDLAKVEAGKVDVKYAVVNVEEFFGVLRGLLRPINTAPAVNLVIEDIPPSLLIRTDEGKLAQILRNLVANALKFTEQGEVRVAVESRGEQVIFRVADSGIGIAPQDQARIFEEFTQVDGPVQRKLRGTGLGLPLSRKLAELLGGTLTVQSTVGSGSTFTLTLPPGIAPPAESPVEPGHSAAETILVIDDVDRDRYLVRQMFRETNFRIIEAADGPEGTERARFEQPRLIILDLAMPGISGFDVLKELKADPVTQSIPVVVHTSLVLNASDRERLGGRQALILPKGDIGQERGLELCMQILKGIDVSSSLG
jgi:signal transduction histidine kinase